MMGFELNAIDRHFADFICREVGDAPPWLGLAVSLASNAVGNGDICLNLADIAGKTIQVDGEHVAVPSLEELKDALQRTQVVGLPGDFRPIILDGDGRLYLYRYWKYEQDLARFIIEKAAVSYGEIDEALLAAGVGRLFPGNGGEGTDWQKVAAVVAVRKRFCVISGGPGTGKTSTVLKIIALFLEQAKEMGVRIALAAPTGKSAARLNESIRLMKEKLDCAPAIKEMIPDEASTIHRLLGSIGGSVRFRYSADNPLPFDAVVIDEASMVALPLMAKLAAALRHDARLILLGDKDQLASVETGAVLGDICGRGGNEPFSSEFADLVARVAGERIPAEPSTNSLPPLTDSLVVLKRNYRFEDDSGIGAVGRAVNAGDGEGAIALLKGESHRDMAWRSVPKPDSLRRALSGTVVAGYGAYLAAGSPAEALERFDAFRVLCALRQGPYGVTGINAIIEEILAEKGLIEPRSRWYRGRPVMITVNDYNLKLFNGDVGIVFPDPEAGGTPRVFFPAPDGRVRKISPVRLPAHETVYAMTIHKSQGSEFDRVLMLLPGHDSEVLTRELIYTGITRAKDEAGIWGDEENFITSVSRRIDRKSGLGCALWYVSDQR
jgi:exodeoxyribonuclease V alpha subunit